MATKVFHMFELIWQVSELTQEEKNDVETNLSNWVDLVDSEEDFVETGKSLARFELKLVTER